MVYLAYSFTKETGKTLVLVSFIYFVTVLLFALIVKSEYLEELEIFLSLFDGSLKLLWYAFAITYVFFYLLHHAREYHVNFVFPFMELEKKDIQEVTEDIEKNEGYMEVFNELMVEVMELELTLQNSVVYVLSNYFNTEVKVTPLNELPENYHDLNESNPEIDYFYLFFKVTYLVQLDQPLNFIELIIARLMANECIYIIHSYNL